MSVAKSPIESQKSIRMGLVLSGFLVAFGFITLLVPVALYHAAQVAAALRLRTAYAWLMLVVMTTLCLGFLIMNEALIFGGLVGLMWFPIFAFALHQRKNNRRFVWTALLFFLPLVAVIAVALFIPREVAFDQFLLERIGVMKNDIGLHEMQNRQQVIATLDEAYKSFRLSAEFRFIDAFLKLEPFQRIAWFIFDTQAAMLFVFGILINTFASLLFLDHAFEQVEKLQSIAKYVVSRASLFPSDLVQSLARFPQPTEIGEGSRTVKIVSHTNVLSTASAAQARSNKPTALGQQVFKFFWKPVADVYVYEFGEYRFRVDESESDRRWWLRGFALPFWMPALGCLMLAGTIWNFGSPVAVIEALGGLPTAKAGFVAVASLFGMFCLSLTSVQGLLTLYARLTPIAMALFVLLVLVVAMSTAMNVYLIVGMLSVVGLLDYAYDLRGRLASRQKKA